MPDLGPQDPSGVWLDNLHVVAFFVELIDVPAFFLLPFILWSIMISFIYFECIHELWER